jgi:cytochrome c553
MRPSQRPRAALRAALPFAWIITLLALAACAGAPDPERGRRLFSGERRVEGYLQCIECHPITPGETAQYMGPNLAALAERAATSVPGEDAPTYLRRAILEPDAFLSAGFQEGIHPRTYAEVLSDQDVADLIAYMLTLDAAADQQ